MKKVINGRAYNTETSKKIGEWDNGLRGNDFGICSEDLFMNSKGTYFLVGEGGPMSKYATHSGNNSGWGNELIPMTKDEAKTWLEENDQDGYLKHFEEPEEAEPDDNRERVTFMLDSKLIDLFRMKSKETDVPMSRYMDKAIQAILDDKI
jgi:hypothetical protein